MGSDFAKFTWKEKAIFLSKSYMRKIKQNENHLPELWNGLLAN